MDLCQPACVPQSLNKKREHQVKEDAGPELMQAPAGQASGLGDARLVARMRLVLALAVLLAVQIEPWGLPGLDPSRWPLFVAYGVYSLAIDAAAQFRQPWTCARWLHWADLLWYGLMVMLTGGVGSMVFLFFFFAILSASFRWGQPEGGRLTLACGAAFAAGAWLAPEPTDGVRLLLRGSFLLGLGYLCVHWGQAQVQMQGRLALLREVSRLSNPRFGAEHTLQHVLRRVAVFYGASSCQLVLKEGASASLRQLGQDASPAAQALSPAMLAALMPLEAQTLVLHRGRRWLVPAATDSLAQERWTRAGRALSRQAGELAGLLEAGSFISAPVALRQGRGRLHVCRQDRALNQDDALFLGQVLAQAFPMIDHIDLLDRLASEAADRERQKFALDLHDTAVQPYLGLKLGLSALRHQAEPGNPLMPGLEKLEAMAGRVAEDLRRYARQVRRQSGPRHALATELRRQAAQVREFYGVDIDVRIAGELPCSDRLSAEVLQVVREGLANICKHTQAQRGEVVLRCQNGWLGICIANDGGALDPMADFTPRSLSERAAALGGRTHVQHEGARTAVHIHIPV